VQAAVVAAPMQSLLWRRYQGIEFFLGATVARLSNISIYLQQLEKSAVSLVDLEQGNNRELTGKCGVPARVPQRKTSR